MRALLELTKAKAYIICFASAILLAVETWTLVSLGKDTRELFTSRVVFNVCDASVSAAGNDHVRRAGDALLASWIARHLQMRQRASMMDQPRFRARCDARWLRASEQAGLTTYLTSYDTQSSEVRRRAAKI